MSRRPRHNTAAQHAREEAALWRYVKSAHRLMLAEVKGEVWWTDSYVALKVDDRFVGMLAEFNLTPEPMVCEVGRTIRRTTAQPPDIAKLIPSLRGAIPVAPLTMGNGRPLLTESVDGDPMELWSTDGKTVTHPFNRRIIAAATRLPGSMVVPTAVNRQGMVMRLDDDGKLLGIAMSVRSDSMVLPWGPVPAIEIAA